MPKSRTVQLVKDTQKSMKQVLESAQTEGYPSEIQNNLNNIRDEFDRLGAQINQSSTDTSTSDTDSTSHR